MAQLNDEMKSMLNDSVDRYLTDNYDFDQRQLIAGSDDGFSAEHWGQFAELGWLGIPFDEKFGGIGGDMFDAMGLARAFGKSIVLEPYISMVGLTAQTLAESDNETLKETVLPDIIAGSTLACLAYEEPQSGSNPSCVGVTADRTGDTYLIRGEKIAVLNAEHSSHAIVSARSSGTLTDDEGINLFWVPLQQGGVSLETYCMVDMHHAANIQFDVEVSAKYRLTEDGQGLLPLQAGLQSGLLMICSEAIGVMQKLMETTLEYANTRQQFGTPIARFQALRHRMVDMYIAFQKVQALHERVVEESRASSEDTPRLLSLLKAQVGKAGDEIGGTAIQVHGGIGMTDELDVGHYLKRLTSITLQLGSTDYHLKKIAHHLFA